MKIVIIGAGSGFGGRLSGDILSIPSLQDSTIALCDINTESLAKVHAYVRRLIEVHKLPAKCVAGTDRDELLPAADCVITSVSVGGPAYWGEPYYSEINIPRKYGVDQFIGDTIGPGGVFRFLRTAATQLDFCKSVEKHCADALMLNYTNPMAMLTWLHSVGSSVLNVGLCHSVQGTTKQLARALDIPYEEISYFVAGINHQAWILSLRRNGEDLYPRLREIVDTSEAFEKESVRVEIFKRFGYYVTESTRHMSEYVPYFRRTRETRDHFNLISRQVELNPRVRRFWEQDTGVAGDENAAAPKLVRSHEYASSIIEARHTNKPFVFNGNVMNHGAITNLPYNCCVEVPCVVDAEGLRPCHVGALPTQCAALNRTNINVQELAVEAVLNRDREAAFHAVALDPLTASVLPLDKIREMFDELWEAEGERLSYFSDPKPQ